MYKYCYLNLGAIYAKGLCRVYAVFIEHSVLTFAVFCASVSVAYEFVDNSFVSCHVTYKINEEQRQNNGYGQDCD